MSSFRYHAPEVPRIQATLAAQVKSLRSRLLQEVSNAIRTSGFTPRARRAISEYLKLRVDATSVSMDITSPDVMYLLRGRKETTMGWLAKAKRPIPIVTEQGDLVFRWPTHKTMADGRWVHPGSKPKDLMANIRARIHPILRDKVREGLRQALREKLR